MSSDPAIFEITALGATGAVLLALASPRMQRWLRGPALLFLGRISYSFYLLHIAVLKLLTPWIIFGLSQGLNRLGVQSLSVLLPAALFATVSITVALSAASYRFIELPSIRLGHKIRAIAASYRVFSPYKSLSESS